MKLFDRDPGCCVADLTACTAAVDRLVRHRNGRNVRGPRTRSGQWIVRSVQVHHVKGNARFWHWLDQVGPNLERNHE